MLQNITIMFNGIINLKRSQPSSRQLSGETQRKGEAGTSRAKGCPTKNSVGARAHT